MKENDFSLKKARNRQYPGETMIDADYTDDLLLLANTPIQSEFLLHMAQSDGAVEYTDCISAVG